MNAPNKTSRRDFLGASAATTTALAGGFRTIMETNKLAEKGPALFPENLDWNADPPVTPDERGNYNQLVPVPGIHKPF